MEDVFKNAQPTEEKPVLDLDETDEVVPTMDDPTWPDYVLKQLQQDEFYNNLPTTDGLRRVVNKLLGPIVYSMPTVIQSPNPQNDSRATVVWQVHVRWDNNPDDVRIFGDVADVYVGNTPIDYCIHATATAATKAEGRALRKALQLKKTITADESSDITPEDPTKINKTQISYINMMCERNDINVKKLLSMSKQYPSSDNVENMPYHVAVNLIKYLNDCQKGQDGNGKKTDFPANIKGYDPNWR